MVNKYDTLYKSDLDESFKYKDASEYEFMIPKRYKGNGNSQNGTIEPAFNVEMGPMNEEVQNCEEKNNWNEKWLLDSGLTINLMNRKERFWNQHESSVTVTVGQGSQVKGQKDGDVVLEEKNAGKNLRIAATYCPDFRKNISSVKRLQLAGYTAFFKDTKATIEDKQTGEITFVCNKGSDRMFYLR
jgi:hypothetical protein